MHKGPFRGILGRAYRKGYYKGALKGFYKDALLVPQASYLMRVLMRYYIRFYKSAITVQYMEVHG